MTWRRSTLCEIVRNSGGLIQTGPFGSQLHQADYVAEGVPAIMPKDIAGGQVDEGTVARVSESTADRLRRHQLSPGAIVLPRRGDVSKRAFIREEQSGWLCGTGCLQVVLSGRELLPEFLYYYMELPEASKWLEQNAVGSTMLNLSASIVGKFPVRFPSRDGQLRVSTLLRTFDDSVANNRRRIALLEDAARQLFREWFVRLRFPGHEHTPLAEGLPAGWRRLKLGELTTKLGSGFTPRGGESSYLPNGTPLIRSMNVYDDVFDDNGLAFVGEEAATALAAVTVEPRDILLNITGASVARCCMAPERHLPARVNQHVMIVRVDPAKADPFFVQRFINSDEPKRRLLSYAQKGSTREALTKEMLTRFEVVLPSDTLMRRFGETASLLFRQKELLAAQNQKLTTARDLLLPRLMSGAITV